MNYSHMEHDSFVCVPWLVRWCAVTHSQSVHRWTRQNTCSCNMTHSHVRCDSFVRDSLAVYALMSATNNSFVWHGSFTRVVWLIRTATRLMRMWMMTRLHVCRSWLTCRLHIVGRDQYLVCATLLIHTCDVTHSYVCRDSRAGYTSLSETNNLCAWQDSFVRVLWLVRTFAVTRSQATRRWARPTTHVPILYSSNPTAPIPVRKWVVFISITAPTHDTSCFGCWN